MKRILERLQRTANKHSWQAVSANFKKKLMDRYKEEKGTKAVF